MYTRPKESDLMWYVPTKIVYSCGHRTVCDESGGRFEVVYSDKPCDLCRSLNVCFVYECGHTFGSEDAFVNKYLHGYCDKCRQITKPLKEELDWLRSEDWYSR